MGNRPLEKRNIKLPISDKYIFWIVKIPCSLNRGSACYQAKYKNKRIPTTLRYNGVEVTDAQEKAELFNNCFNLVFKRDNCVPIHEDYFFSDNDNHSLSNITLSPAMVKEFLDQLDASKSCGPDGLTLRLLKECSKLLSIPLCTLFNKQLDSGCFPRVWKIANLVQVQIWRWEIVEKEYHCCASYQKSLKNVCFRMFFPFFNHK